MKRLLFLASFAIFAMGAAACTREKPTDATPAPQVAAADVTPGTPGAALTPTTPVPTNTPALTPTEVITPTAFPTSIPTAVPTSAPVSPISAPGTYTVQWGDTLYSIAGKFGTTVAAITAANSGMNPNWIVPGQALNIPAPGTQPIPPPPGSVPVSPPTSACSPTYTVQRGDWVYELARRFGVSVSALIAANPGFNANLLYPNQVLNIPCGSGTVPPNPGPGPTGNTYTVRQGDTLFSIAVRLGTSIYALQIANHLPNPNFIYAGQVLIIPR